MIKDKLTKKIDEILSERDSAEMAFTKGFRTASESKFLTLKIKVRTKLERKLI